MPIETDHHTPWCPERYRFHPWHERPLTEGQVRIVLMASWSVAAVLVASAGITVWLAGWPVRCLVEPVVVVVIVIIASATRDAWSEFGVNTGADACR